MAAALAQLSAGEIAARDLGIHMFGATNALDDRAEVPVWSTSGLFSNSRSGQGSNVDDPAFEPSRAFDRFIHLVTKPVALGGAQDVYFLMHLTPGTDDDHTIDLLALKVFLSTLLVLGGNITIRVEISDDEDFGAPLRNILTTTGDFGLDQLLITTNLTNNVATPTINVRYTDVEFIRIRFTTGDGAGFGASVPQLSECILTRRRQMAHFPRIPYDDQPRSSDFADFVSKSGITTRHARSQGQKNLDLRMRPTDSNLAFPTIDERNELRSWYKEIAFGRKPFLYVDDPLHANAPAGHYMFARDDLRMALFGPIGRNFRMRLREQAPYSIEDANFTL